MRTSLNSVCISSGIFFSTRFFSARFPLDVNRFLPLEDVKLDRFASFGTPGPGFERIVSLLTLLGVRAALVVVVELSFLLVVALGVALGFDGIEMEELEAQEFAPIDANALCSDTTVLERSRTPVEAYSGKYIGLFVSGESGIPLSMPFLKGNRDAVFVG